MPENHTGQKAHGDEVVDSMDQDELAHVIEPLAMNYWIAAKGVESATDEDIADLMSAFDRAEEELILACVHYGSTRRNNHHEAFMKSASSVVRAAFDYEAAHRKFMSIASCKKSSRCEPGSRRLDQHEALMNAVESWVIRSECV